MRRLAALGGIVFVVTVWLLAAPAQAQDVGVKEALVELDRSRALLDRALALYEEGRSEDAYVAARNSYLDHFEYVEIPLRIRDEGLTLEVEEDFAALRNLIEAGAPLGEVEDITAEVRRGLDDVERTLAEPGVAAPLLAFGYAFTILFREGLEAVLVVAAILGYLEASRNTQYRAPVLRGVAGAGIATAITFVLATAVIRLAPLQREILEAVTAALAVVVLFYVSFWLITRLEHRRWMEFVKTKVWNAATTGSTLALVGVGFTAVYREGFETVLFYQALISFAQGLIGYVISGTVVAAVVLAGIGWVIFKAGRRIPVKPFLTTAVTLVMLLSIALAGNAVRGFQVAAVLPVTFLEGLPDLPIFLSQLTGWYPTRETILVQALLASIYVIGAAWTFLVMPRRERRAGRAIEPSPSSEAEVEEPTGAR
ncbi:MAG: FTR1 family protein [Actinomycetota bacterium]|nr:FTR1 family protein [Actinomycetota bacterium]